jgi:hypothetical protein
MVDVSLILKAFSGPASMIPRQNSSTTPRPGKALTQIMSCYFHPFVYSYHLSPNLLIFVHGNTAKGMSA